MPEGLSGEVAHKLSEHEATEHHPARWHGLLEIIEVILLAVVAIATAWSGLQASRWDGQQSLRYGQASRDRFEADAASTLAGQQLSADAAMFTAWLQAHSANDPKLQALIVRRFTPDYRIAFDAWLTTDPFGNPSAPPGPAAMPQYSNPNQQKANQLNSQASATLRPGQFGAGQRGSLRTRHCAVRVRAIPGRDCPTVHNPARADRPRRSRRGPARLPRHLACSAAPPLITPSVCVFVGIGAASPARPRVWGRRPTE